jgi:translocation and assembly module TamB
LSGNILGSTPLKVSTQVQELNLRFADLKWKNDKPFAIELAGRRINLTPFELLGPATRFQVQGSAALGPPSELNLTADGEIDSAFLHLFTPGLLTTGHFDVQAQVRGTLDRPSVFGSLHIHDVSLGYPRLPLQVAGLNGDVDLEGDRVTIRNLRAESGPASVTITGGAVLSGTPRYNLRADLNSLRVDYPIQFTSVLSGSIHLSGTPGAGVLSGDLTVAQMFVGQNFNVLNWASALENQPAIVTGTAPAIASGVRLDVHVASAPVVSIESHDLNAVATIDLDLRGTITDPVAFGNVHIQSGQAVLRQSNYRLSRGDITMSNPQRTEPVLDLEAKTRIERYDLILRITGPADHPSISYRSDPPLSTPSILALLAFGYTSQDQLIGQTGRSNLSAEGANALLTQALSTQVSSRITRLFGLSRIGVDPNPSSLGGARVTVEEQLRRDFTITYVNTTGGIEERIIQVEWDATDNISLLGIRDQNGVYGLELDFRHRFK